MMVKDDEYTQHCIFSELERYANPNKLLFESPQPNLLPLEKG